MLIFVPLDTNVAGWLAGWPRQNRQKRTHRQQKLRCKTHRPPKAVPVSAAAAPKLSSLILSQQSNARRPECFIVILPGGIITTTHQSTPSLHEPPPAHEPNYGRSLPVASVEPEGSMKLHINSSSDVNEAPARRTKGSIRDAFFGHFPTLQCSV